MLYYTMSVVVLIIRELRGLSRWENNHLLAEGVGQHGLLGLGVHGQKEMKGVHLSRRDGHIRETSLEEGLGLGGNLEVGLGLGLEVADDFGG